jgi:predicted amidohydrolase
VSAESLTVAAAQIACAAGDVAANLTRHLELIAEARSRGVDLLVFPELSLTDYLSAPDLATLALAPTSDEVARLADAARGIAISFGFIERDRIGACHNAQALVADGRVVHIHRKANLPSYGQLREAEQYRPGRAIRPARLNESWLLATLICADVWNPALPWLAALQGIDLLLVPAASSLHAVEGDFDNPAGWEVTLRHAAMTYGLPIVMANHCGTRDRFAFWGGSRILDACGRELARAGENEELIVTAINHADISAARARLPTIRDADPELVQAELARVLAERGRP